MKIENQVCSLELAKKLKELGFKQESLFWWCRVWSSDLKSDIWIVRDRPGGLHIGASVSAYTASELGELLPLYAKIPSNYKVDDGDWELQINNANGVWNINYTIGGYGYSHVPIEQSETDKNFANAIAKMLIYLKENNLI